MHQKFSAFVALLLIAGVTAGVDVLESSSLRGGRSLDDFPIIHGTNLGGWLVLEPWITPSLFDQFQTMENKAYDMLHFCEYLGHDEAQRQLTKHWDNFVTAENISDLARAGINTIRIPVGYWLWGDASDGFCKGIDGSKYLKWALDEAHKNGVRVLIDLHGVRGSQNGFDNSGLKTDKPQWALHPEYMEETLETLARIGREFGNHPAAWGIEAVNEPRWDIDINELKGFYRRAYDVIHAAAPKVVVVFHDGFRADEFKDFMLSSSTVQYNIAIDTHMYQAFGGDNAKKTAEEHQSDACGAGDALAELESLGQKYFVGEWSLAMDDCAMWLLGFQAESSTVHDAKMKCSSISCPNFHASSNPFLDGPDGKGSCPCDVEKDNEAVAIFAHNQIHSFERAHGFMFWNFKTELAPRWNFLEAYFKRGWFPSDLANPNKNTCS